MIGPDTPIADALATLTHRLVGDGEALIVLRRVEDEIARLEHLHKLDHSLADQWLARAETAEAKVARLKDGLRPIVREYDLWSEDANDGEFRLWDLDRLVVAIVVARDLLAEDGAAPHHNPRREYSTEYISGRRGIAEDDFHDEDGAA